ncbi:MAG: TIGR00725 family protein [Gemmatimonadota bacterium]
MRVGVIGSASADETTRELARAVGRALGRAEAILVCGGLGGVMDAAAEGAAEEGGLVLGILPGGDAEDAAAGVSIPMPTGLGPARNTLVVRTSEAIITIAGGWGTLNEAAMAMKLGIPLVGVRDHLPETFEIERFENPAAAVARALELAHASRRAGGSR